MEVQEVTVTIHEKRNHITGDRDCEVRIRAVVDDSDNADMVIEILRQRARTQVDAELDAWLYKVTSQQCIFLAQCAIDDVGLASTRRSLATRYNDALGLLEFVENDVSRSGLTRELERIKASKLGKLIGTKEEEEE